MKHEGGRMSQDGQLLGATSHGFAWACLRTPSQTARRSEAVGTGSRVRKFQADFYHEGTKARRKAARRTTYADFNLKNLDHGCHG